MTRRGLLSVALAGLCVVSLLAAAPLFDQADSPAARTLLGIEGTPTPAGRVAAARPWLLRAALALATGALVAPALGPGLDRAAADAATHATLGGAFAVAGAGSLATRLLGTAGTPTLRRPAGWLAATAGAGAVLAGAFALPAAVGVATRTALVTVPGLLTVVGTHTGAAGATTVRAVVTPLVVLLALAPALALLVGLAVADRVALLRRERGPAALAAGLLAASALVSAVLTRDPARTIAARRWPCWPGTPPSSAARWPRSSARTAHRGSNGPTRPRVWRSRRSRGRWHSAWRRRSARYRRTAARRSCCWSARRPRDCSRCMAAEG